MNERKVMESWRGVRVSFLWLATVVFAVPCVAEPRLPGRDGAISGHAMSASRPSVAPSIEVYAPGSRQAHGQPRLRGFLDRYTDDWEVRWDARSDLPHLLQGSGVPLLPGRGNTLAAVELKSGANGPIRLDEVAARLRRFMIENPELLGVSTRELRLDRRRSGGYGPDRYLWLVELQQVYRGLPVIGARVFFRVNHGNLVQLGTRRIAAVDLETEPSVTPESALAPALEAIGLHSFEAEVLDPGSLEILPVAPAWEIAGGIYSGAPGDGYRHRLVWRFVVRPRQGPHTYELLVDAHRGDLLRVRDLDRFAAGKVVGGVRPLTGTASVPVLFPFLKVRSPGPNVTDAEGRFEYDGVAETTTWLAGQYIDVEDDCGEILLASDDGLLDFGSSAGSDCATPGFGGLGNTHAARTGFYYLSRLHRKAAAFLPENPWLGTALTVRTNLEGDSCNASWNDGEGSVSFYRAGGGCANTGELPGLLVHEWGHGMDSHAGGVAEDAASGEALADTFAFLETGDACIGAGLRPGNACHNCGRECTGVRDLAVLAFGGAATLARPETVEDDQGLDCDRFACPYLTSDGPPLPYQGPMGYEAHCESQIASSANWDLARLLVNDLGAEGGKQAMEELLYGSLNAAGSAYRLTPGAATCDPGPGTVDGCAADNWYTVYLAVDDDDGNLANGTPNICRIWKAFDAHGIACGGPPACTCTRSPFADAGVDRTIHAGESVEIGPFAASGQSYTWTPGGQGTARIEVSPLETTVYYLEVSNACGSSYDKVTVFVDHSLGDPGEPDGSFVGGIGTWTAGGLWHQVVDSVCAQPGYASPYSAVYYGRDESCNFATGTATTGDLISPEIADIESDSYLSFQYLRQVEHADGPWDRTELAISVAGSDYWQPRWARDARHPSAGVWEKGDPISLAPYAGRTIRLRFRFDSVDQSFNQLTGWLVDDVVIGGGFSWSDNTPPQVTVASPLEESADECVCVLCSASATDAEDGDLASIISWHSDVDGDLGPGGSFSTILSEGLHTLTASVTDSGGLSTSADVTLRVTTSEGGPCAQSWPPAEPRRYCGED